MVPSTMGRAGTRAGPIRNPLLYEKVDDSIAEAMGGFANEIIVTLHADNAVSVTTLAAASHRPREPNSAAGRRGGRRPAERVFETLMGVDVDPRKQFIKTHALNVRGLDT